MTFRFSAVLLFTAFAIVGCTERSGPTAPAAPNASLAQVGQSETPDPADVAQVVPGFGGYFLAAGRPTVYLTDPAQRPAAEDALAGWLTSRGFTASDLDVRVARYDWATLDGWYQRAWPAALSVSGAVLSDVDEGQNRLRFGGVDASAVAAMSAALAGTGVPTDAYVVQQVPAISRLVTLQDRAASMAGGYQINFFASPVSPVTLVCTLGFSAIPESPPNTPAPSFIVNSHCSNTEGDGVQDTTTYFQPLRDANRDLLPDSANYIGKEVDDPSMNISPNCPLPMPCRWADAARAEYAPGVPFSLGKIARPAAFDPVAGTLDVDPTHPTFTIKGEQALSVLGETADKVGRTTGWTGGVITGTCVDVIAIGGVFMRRCQTLVAAGSGGGDSGSPVFGFPSRRTHEGGNKVILFGILWGGSTDSSIPEFVFSPMFNIERELGLLKTFDSTAPN